MNIDDVVVEVTLPSGDVWGLPLRFVAENRAAHFAGEFDGDINKSLENDTWPLFFSCGELDSYEIRDWIIGNMDWDAMKHRAWLVRSGKDKDGGISWDDIDIDLVAT